MRADEEETLGEEKVISQMIQGRLGTAAPVLLPKVGERGIKIIRYVEKVSEYLLTFSKKGV